jgi:hypothetical protein
MFRTRARRLFHPTLAIFTLLLTLVGPVPAGAQDTAAATRSPIRSASAVTTTPR